MIPLDPVRLLDECRASEKLLQRHQSVTRKLIRRFVGNYYREDFRGAPVPENMLFSYVATLLPQVVFTNPAVTCRAPLSRAHATVAAWMKDAMNIWIQRLNIRDELEEIAVDFLFNFGVARVGLEPRGDYANNHWAGVEGQFNAVPLQPFMIRQDPNDTIIDAMSKKLRGARLLGHRFQRDLADLQDDPRYEQDVVAKLTSDNERRAEAFSSKNIEPQDRDRVTLYQLYLPEHCATCTIAAGGDGQGQFVRVPKKWKGPESGPYVFFGVYAVPGQVYPLSPLAAMAEQFVDLNAHAAAAGREASAHKRLLVVDADAPDAESAIVQAPTGSVVRLSKFSPQMAMNVEIGGTSAVRLDYIERLRDRLDRVIGFSDAQRGRSADVTATEATITDQNAASRTKWIQTKFRMATREALKNVGHYLFYDDAVVMEGQFTMKQPDPVGGIDQGGQLGAAGGIDPNGQLGAAGGIEQGGAAGGGQLQDGVFQGGFGDEDVDMHWPDFNLDIEPYSMEMVDPAKEQAWAMASLNVALSVGPMIPQLPWINWRALLDDMGEANNIPDFAERVLNQLGLAMVDQQPQAAAGAYPGFNPQQPGQLPPGASQGAQMAAAGSPQRGTPGTNNQGASPASGRAGGGPPFNAAPASAPRSYPAMAG